VTDDQLRFVIPNVGAELDLFMNGTSRFTFSPTQLALTSGVNIDVSDNAWIGLGSGAGRIVFDDQTPDYVLFEDCRIGINYSTPEALVHIGFATEDLELVDAGSSGATEAGWIQVQLSDTTGYIRIYLNQ
jgi:hypothetical protein